MGVRNRVVANACGFRAKGGLSSELRIDFLVERDAESLVLNPGDAASDPADIAQFNFDPVAALDAQRAFAHHSAIREVSDADAMLFAFLFNAHARKQKQAVARITSGLNTRHFRQNSYTRSVRAFSAFNERPDK